MDSENLVRSFEENRAHLQSVAFRLLGSATEADDAVQEAWLRLTRIDASGIDNLSGWLTTVVARVCLDMLRARKSRREDPLLTETDTTPDPIDPEREAMLSEAVGLAMLAVLQRLAPAERVAFVLHDVFGVSFDEIAEIVGRTPVATRQLASRGRRRVHGAPADSSSLDLEGHRHVVEAFFRASRAGDFEALIAVLDPNVELRPDQAGLEMGRRNGWITSILRGPEAVAGRLSGQALGVELVLIDGVPGGAWMANGRIIVAFSFTIEGGHVTEIELIADQAQLADLEIVPL